MRESQELRNIIHSLFKMDEGLNLYAPGFVDANEAEQHIIPWLGLQNLNRTVYMVMNFYYFFYQEMIAECSLGVNAEKSEPIIVELKDNFMDLITLEKKGLLTSKTTPISSQKSLLIKDIFKFVKAKPDKFNDFIENDPNIQKIMNMEGSLTSSLIINDKDVYEYYSAFAKLIFAR